METSISASPFARPKVFPPPRQYLTWTKKVHNPAKRLPPRSGCWLVVCVHSIHGPAFHCFSPNVHESRETTSCRQHLPNPEESTDGSTASKMKVAIRATPLSRGVDPSARQRRIAAMRFASPILPTSSTLAPVASKMHQPRRRGQKRSSTSIHDLMSDFSLVRDSKSTRIPHGFVSELEKRLTGVLMGKEKRKEYQDHLVVRTFAAFLNVLEGRLFPQAHGEGPAR